MTAPATRTRARARSPRSAARRPLREIPLRTSPRLRPPGRVPHVSVELVDSLQGNPEAAAEAIPAAPLEPAAAPGAGG